VVIDNDILRIHAETNTEIVCTLDALNERIEALGTDAQLDALMCRLREVLAKRFLLNGITDWQRESCSRSEGATTSG